MLIFSFEGEDPENKISTQYRKSKKIIGKLFSGSYMIAHSDPKEFVFSLSDVFI